jgi:ElaB/YqjD/DUF883 family membrane-anchored ribosome-binding protein
MFGQRKSMTDQARAKARKASQELNLDALDDLFDDFEAITMERLQSLRDSIRKRTDQLRWDDLRDNAQQEFNRASEQTGRYVRRHPWQAVGLAALVILAITSLKDRS